MQKGTTGGLSGLKKKGEKKKIWLLGKWIARAQS